MPMIAATDFRPVIHALIGGHPTAGKSTGLTTFPKPLIVNLFDGLGKDGPYLKWGRERGAMIRDDRIHLANGQDTGITSRHIETQTEGEIVINYFNDISPESFCWYWWELYLKERSYLAYLANASNPSGAGTFACDSVTFMEICARKYWCHQIAPPGSLEKKDGTSEKWAPRDASTDRLEDSLVVHLGGIPVNYVVLAHFSNAKVDLNGRQLYTISAPGRLESQKILPALFAEQYRAFVEDDSDNPGQKMYLWQTKPDPRFHCASQIGAPDPCWQDYNSLWEGY